ncbi:creatininase family protein [Streptomyces genisteinicus]|uniref:Creatininase family protein n=2 Tax=Streptomyces genisteinicus TaxID=2768068 RepID=A0A7H0I464_9ACTN|nr:creatininase family protein [Streptomyces genisteinicus]
MSWRDFRDGAAAGRLCVLPVGAVEPHGPHLPLTSDTLLSEYFAARLCEQLPAFVMPAIGYGVATPPFRLGGDFPGVVSVSGTAFTHLVTDVLLSLAGNGVRDVVVVNSAIDNLSFLCEAARQAREHHPHLRIMVVHWWDVVGEEFRDALAAETAVSRADDHHAGMVESSLVMHVAPDGVRPELAHADGEDLDAGATVRRTAYHMFPLPSDSATRSGIVYRADRADAEIGGRVAARVVRAMAEAVRLEFGPAAAGGTVRSPLQEDDR